MRKIVLAGGTGFLGTALARWFHADGWQVVVLSRQTNCHVPNAQLVYWDGANVGAWASELEGATAVVNLAGRTVNCRYTPANRQAILASRIDSTRVLGQAIAECLQPPQVWLNSSTATIYRHSFDQPMDEQSGQIAATPEAKDQFSIEVATAWEREFHEAQVPNTRQLTLRTAMVLSTASGTVYRVLRRLARLGLGGAMAGGRQYVSWIHEEDFCLAVAWLIEREACSGVFNLAAPHPLTNRQLMRTLRSACRMPIGLPATRAMLELGAVLLRTETELIIKSRRVVPTRLLSEGFLFRYAHLAGAVEDLERQLKFPAPRARRPAEAVAQPPVALRT